MITFKNQLALVVYFTLFGIFLAATYDILHYYLRRWKVKAALGYVIQSIYWLGMMFVACLYAFRVSEGLISIYTFFFFFAGGLIYRALLRFGLHSDLERFSRGARKAYGFIKKWLSELVYSRELALLFLKVKSTIKKKLLKIKRRKKSESK